MSDYRTQNVTFVGHMLLLYLLSTPTPSLRFHYATTTFTKSHMTPLKQ